MCRERQHEVSESDSSISMQQQNDTVCQVVLAVKIVGMKRGCNREVAPLKQRFSTRCNRMAVSDAVCVI